MAQSLDERIARMERFKDHLKALGRSESPEKRDNIRSFINQNKIAVRTEVIEAKAFRTMTISPPPAVGGYVMKNVDAFEMIFDPPYGMNMAGFVIDMIDSAIGVMKSTEYQSKIKEQQNIDRNIQLNIEKGYVFVAMPMSNEDPSLVDVLDSIKESCSRCDLIAERVDDENSNLRITDRIIESIRKAEHVVVDLTHSKPKVYYEAGYAHGCGKIPIYIARAGTQLEFDLTDYPVIFFNNNKELKDRLEKRIRGLKK